MRETVGDRYYTQIPFRVNVCKEGIVHNDRISPRSNVAWTLSRKRNKKTPARKVLVGGCFAFASIEFVSIHARFRATVGIVSHSPRLRQAALLLLRRQMRQRRAMPSTA